MFSFPKRWPTSDSDGVLSALIVLLPIAACLFLVWGFNVERKQMTAGYESHVASAGYSTPKTMEEALRWIYESENIPMRNGVHLATHNETDPEILTETDNLTTELYGWGVAVTHPSYCNRDKNAPWNVKIIYVVGGQVVESYTFPVTGDESYYTLTQDFPTVKVDIKVSFDYDCGDSTTDPEVFIK